MSLFNKKGITNENIEINSNKKVKKSNDVQKLDEKISQENVEINEIFTQIGKLYYELYKNDSNDKLVPLCNVVDESYRIIKLCEKQALILQGVQLCPNCKARVSLDSLFCNKCGSKIETDEELELKEKVYTESSKTHTKEAKETSIKCRECGTPMPSDIVFCTNCGAKIK